MMIPAALFGLALLVSFLGWGKGLARLMGDRLARPAGREAFLGLSVLIWIGGWLNLFSLLHPIVLWALVFLGCALFCAFGSRRARLDCPSIPAGAALVLSLLPLTLLYLSFCRGWSFNPADDFLGYLVWPAKILQTGSLGSDPFSQRRFSMLGSNSFLQAVVLSIFPMENIHVAEPGVGMLLTALLGYGALRRSRWNFAAPAFFLLSGIGFGIAPRSNVSSLILGLGFCAALLLEVKRCASVRALFLADCLALALLSAGLVTLKGTMALLAPAALGALFLVRICGALRAEGSAARELAWAFSTAALYAVFLFPWEASSVASTGTWYYPFLGQGYFVKAYHDVDGLMRASTRPLDFYYAAANCLTFPTYLASFLIALSLLVRKEKRDRALFLGWALLTYLFVLFLLQQERKLFVGWLGSGALFVGIRGRREILARGTAGLLLGLFAVWACGFAIYVGMNGVAYQRYYFPLSFGLLLAAFTTLLADPRLPRAFVAAVAAFTFLFSFTGIAFDDGAPWGPARIAGSFVRDGLNVLEGASAAGLRTLPPPEKLEALRRIQTVVPAGARILVRTAYNFAFDFARNPVWIADVPEEISPPPGMPYRKGPRALAAYLKGQGICYLVVTYDKNGDMYDGQVASLNHYYPWERAEARMAIDFYDNTLALAAAPAVLADDGANRVIKLCD